jgi:predicted TIM-barrel fold metal-dependent hydrolase
MAMPDRSLSSLVVSAYNDWHKDEWCDAYPGRFIPLAILPVWDVDAAVAEIHRLARRGVTAVTFPETPHAVGLPSFYGDHWNPVLRALCDEDMVLCLHIGGAFKLLARAPEAGLDQQIIMSPQLSALACNDLIVGGVFRRFPDLRVAMSEGGIGWIPPLLDRIEHHLRTQTWLGLDIGARSPRELFDHNLLGCFIWDSSTLRLRDRIGVGSLAWESDYPHSESTWPRGPELLAQDLDAAGVTPAEAELVTWANASRFFRYEPFVHRTREEATVRALRSHAGDVDTATTSKETYRRRYEATVGA